VKIDASPADGDAAPNTPPRMADIGQQASALALAVLGLVMLINAQFMPWVTVRAGIVDRLFGQDSGQAVRTFRLVDLSKRQLRCTSAG
jgi:hypothetical protein